ncbi:MAG: GAF domain-containing protein [Phycisphaerales bacterium]
MPSRPSKFNRPIKFYALGERIVRWCRQANLPAPNHPAVVTTIPLGLGASVVWLELSANKWSAASAIAFCILEAFVLYLNGASAQLAQEPKAEVWDRVQRLNADATGHLVLLLEAFAARHRAGDAPRLGKAAYQERLRGLQQHLLSHAVNMICASADLDSKTSPISANWCLRREDETDDQFRVIVYDKNMPDRRPKAGNWRPIASARPGASQAFLTGCVNFVDDTHSEEYREFFDNSPTYRSILSVPVECSGSVIGVMNVDASEPETLVEDHQHLVLDIAQLIGWCELLRNEENS